jgi:hypothetical protein
MTTTTYHWQLGVGPTHSLCGLSDTGEPHRCLTRCDPCEGDRDKVNCPTCIGLGASILENLRYFHREGGPHDLCITTRGIEGRG